MHFIANMDGVALDSTPGMYFISCTLKFIMTKFSTVFHNVVIYDMHIWKNEQDSGSNRRPLDLKADASQLSYGIACRDS